MLLSWSSSGGHQRSAIFRCLHRCLGPGCSAQTPSESSLTHFCAAVVVFGGHCAAGTSTLGPVWGPEPWVSLFQLRWTIYIQMCGAQSSLGSCSGLLLLFRLSVSVQPQKKLNAKNGWLIFLSEQMLIIVWVFQLTLAQLKSSVCFLTVFLSAHTSYMLLYSRTITFPLPVGGHEVEITLASCTIIYMFAPHITEQNIFRFNGVKLLSQSWTSLPHSALCCGSTKMEF